MQTTLPQEQEREPEHKSQIDIGYVWRISVVAALGGLLFGWDWVVIGGAKPFFEPFFDLPVIAAEWERNGLARALGLTTPQALSGWANSCALLGCLGGSLMAGWMSDRIGRKKLLILAAFLFAVSSVLTGWAGSFNQFIVWRMLGGVAIGMASNVSPLYIAEIAPAQMRGRLVTLNQLTIVFGILAAQLINMVMAQRVPEHATAEYIAASWIGRFGWRWMFTLVAAPSLIFLGCSLLVPESPRWLMKRGRDAQARAVLERIGGARYGEAEARAIRSTLSSEQAHAVRLRDLLAPSLLRVLLIGCALAVLQQWSGINVLFNYARRTYSKERDLV